jgi:hypothetical protein
VRISSLRLALTLAAVSSCLFAAAARAEFGPIDLVSKTAREQSGFALQPAISADGRYLALCGSLGGREGIYREQLDSGQIESVATTVGEGSKCRVEASFAYLPSISADGRFISFTTLASLAPGDGTPETSDVYVADLSTTPPTYELASAASGSFEALEGGSFAAGRAALSGTGRRVAFVNRGEVYVRDLDAGTTTLISARRDPVSGLMVDEPVSGGGAYEPAGAAISADGSTVAWVGEHLPEQVPLLGDEEALIRSIEEHGDQGPSDHQNEYHEPLWRRVPVAPGEDPPTRRVVGGGDPLAPGCPPGGTLDDLACQGPYPEVANSREITSSLESTGAGWGLVLPQLSADGKTVAVVGNPGEQGDLFVVDMRPGLDRREAVRQLTKWTNPAPGESNPEKVLIEPKFWPLTGAVDDCAISPDGSRIAFTATRQRFPLAPPTLITPQPAAPSQLQELYQVDLAGGTIERATPGDGEDVSLGDQNQGATSPSFGAGERLIAFASNAYNLVAGDANEASDVFLVESPPPPTTAPSVLSSRPPSLVLQPRWRLSASASSRPDGSVRVVAVVPGGGTLRARAKAQLGSRLKLRRVAGGERRAGTASMLRLALKLPRRLRPLSRRRGGLGATISVSFAGPGGQPLHALLDTRFLVHGKGSDKGPGR